MIHLTVKVTSDGSLKYNNEITLPADHSSTEKIGAVSAWLASMLAGLNLRVETRPLWKIIQDLSADPNTPKHEL